MDNVIICDFYFESWPPCIKKFWKHHGGWFAILPWKKWNASYETLNDDRTKITFNTEQDKTLFLLRWG